MLLINVLHGFLHRATPHTVTKSWYGAIMLTVWSYFPLYAILQYKEASRWSLGPLKGSHRLPNYIPI